LQTDGAAILTDGCWRQRFNGDPGVLGRSIRIDGLSKTIVGVLPPDFCFLSSKAQIFLPLSSSAEERALNARHVSGTETIARLKPGAALIEAQAEIDADNAAHAGRGGRLPHANNTFFVVMGTSQVPASLSSTLQTAVRKLDSDLPIDDLRSMEVRIADSLITRRSPALLAGIFALAALLLAAIGTYGVLSYAVAQRRREIGVRMALGALPKQIANQFRALGLRLFGAGAMLRIAGAWLARRAMQSILFDVPAVNMAMLAATSGIMAVVSLVACWLPARRAARVDPMVALKHE
jgi:hypothetical protein